MSTIVTARSSRLTGAELRRMLAYLGKSNAGFAYDCGVNSGTVAAWCSGKADGKIPVVADLALLHYARECPTDREGHLRVDLPRESWLHDKLPAASYGRRGRPRREVVAARAAASAVELETEDAA